MLWYDTLIDAVFMADVYTRLYADDRQYRWGRDLFAKVWIALRTEKSV